MSASQELAAKRLKVILLAVPEIIGCAIHGAWCGARDGITNIRSAWNG